MTVSLHLSSSDQHTRRTLSAISLAVAKSRRVVIVTGAGISCSCGIPDFRSTDGLYNLVKAQYPNAVVKGRDLFDSALFRDPVSTAIFYTFIAGLKTSIDTAEPSPTHRFIKALDTKGKLLRSYTQNIDGLEERVGLLGTSSEAALAKGKGKAAASTTKGSKLKVNEVKSVLLHGDIHRVRCTLCSASFVCEEAHLNAFRTGTPPECPECSSRSSARVARSARPLTVGILRPAIVLYDEPHPLGDEIGALETRDLGRKPDLLIIMGTSLKVHGLKKLVKEFATVIHQNAAPAVSATGKPTNKGLLNNVIFVNKTAPGSEWAGVIDYHVEGLTDAWTEKVVEDWKKMRPADWEVQTTLEDANVKVVKEVVEVKQKPSKSAGKKKAERKDTENVAPVRFSSQSSEKTLVDENEKPLKVPLRMSSKLAKPRRQIARMGSVSAPELTFGSSAPAPLSPSKRQNRTYTAAAAGKSASRASSEATLLEQDEECASDVEPPSYDSESERGSPRKKRRSPADMSIDDIEPAMPQEERKLLFPSPVKRTAILEL